MLVPVRRGELMKVLAGRNSCRDGTVARQVPKLRLDEKYRDNQHDTVEVQDDLLVHRAVLAHNARAVDGVRAWWARMFDLPTHDTPKEIFDTRWEIVGH